MDNEETIIMPPIPNSTPNQKANSNPKASFQQVAKSKGNGGKVAAAVAGTAVTGVAGTAVGYAAATMLDEQQPEVDEPVATVEPEPEPEPTPKVEEPTADASQPADVGVEPNYVDYSSDGVQAQATATEVSAVADDTDASEVQVLGVYEAEGNNGQMMEAALLTDGQEVAAVVDIDGDGGADAIWVDSNNNLEIDEGEVYDISDDHMQMQTYEDAYLAQQQEQQEQQELQAYNAGADQQDDFTNDADLTDC